ncbi:protein E4A [Elephant endotheliotropic herpesvirus 3A]|uniref:Protein E4A n=1 Tax=Elephant endotheliotropic herpesvirus 3A TaxID=1329409 RepID=A0A866VSJ4_9BETA|nr:protein E4A [Elephant endotheliotropic herpesvirus 3A]QOE74364.1 protein E4A [Elephant endotheliotropic herpesvirus 3A]
MTLGRYSTRYGSVLFFLAGVAISSIKLVCGANSTSSPVPTGPANVSWARTAETDALSVTNNTVGGDGSNITTGINDTSQSKNDSVKVLDQNSEYWSEDDYYYPLYEDIRVIFPRFFSVLHKRKLLQKSGYKEPTSRIKRNVKEKKYMPMQNMPLDKNT